MVRIEIDTRACRGCQMCVDICPTKVFDFDAAEAKARVREAADCIACLSCRYLCPSGAIAQEDYPVVKNFYRDLEFVGRLERFL
jgi:NAD-dependent dihydropyrimidine dehydrogenase PreA subunit